MSATVPVPAGPCSCPGAPHAEDIVHLREKLGLAAGVQLQARIVQANQQQADTAELTGQLAEAYLLVGVDSWNLVDDKGKPLPVTPESIREQLLDDFTRAIPIADKADDLYMAAVIGPLVKAGATSSPSTTTDGSMSVMDGGSPKPPKRSRRSSTSTIQTDAIAPI